jgi:hypothetical protein
MTGVSAADDPSSDIPWLRSVVQIEQLSARYALAVDSRNIEALIGLFVPDVRVGRDATGREALRAWYTSALRSVGATVHFVGNRTVDVIDEANATGVVYCREEVQDLVTDQWRVGMIQYWDTYRRVDRDWLFVRRQVFRWYTTDLPPSVSAPAAGGSADRLGPGERPLPESFDTWSTFWGQ